MSFSAVVIVIFPDHTHLLFSTVFTFVTSLTVFMFVCFIAAVSAKLTVFRRCNTHLF